jgi:pilus assembly protein CpaC
MIDFRASFLHRYASRGETPDAAIRLSKGSTMTNKKRTTSKRLALAGGTTLLLAAHGAISAPAFAADFGAPVTHAAATPGALRGNAVIAIGSHEGAMTRRVDLSIGKSIIIDLPRDAKEVFVANPEIANAVVRSTRKIFLIGRENGATSVFVFDADGNQKIGRAHV